MTKVEMVIDSVRVALINYQRAVILKEKAGERHLPMWVDGAQADAIATGLQKARSSKPLTHDFICSIINDLGDVLKYVIVGRLIEATFHAKAFLEREGKVIEVNCRPSDGIATALKAETPIFVTEAILKKAGIKVDEPGKLDEGKEEA